jgi:hypothetical protein
MKNNIILKIATEFSPTPGPRYNQEGMYSGESFRESILKIKMQEAIQNDVKLIVDLDNVCGYGTSFLEEAFGGLIRVNGFKKNDVLDHLEIVSTEEDYLTADVIQYIVKSQVEKR